MNTMRITFTNTTTSTLSDIEIKGCESRHIDKMEPRESTTLWIDIPRDCSIDIGYMSKGQRKEENVVGYTTNSMGGKMNYNIGGPNEEHY